MDVLNDNLLNNNNIMTDAKLNRFGGLLAPP